LERRRISEALGGRATRGHRTVAGYDEDTTTMAVEAGRRLSCGLDANGVGIDALLLATTDPAYADKTNATAAHAALGLPEGVHASDVAGSVRSGMGAVLSGLRSNGCTLVLLSDIRTGASGGTDEVQSGDGAAALVLGTAEAGAPLIAEIIGRGSATAEFLDRWRVPGQDASSSWEERFGERQYIEAAKFSLGAALSCASVSAADINHVAVTGLAPRAAKSFLKSAGFEASAIVDDLQESVGNSGAAHPGLLLASILDVVEPGQLFSITVLADGAETLIFRATDEVVSGRQRLSLAAQVKSGSDALSYLDFLTWRGNLRRQLPRRPEPDRTSAPASRRLVEWKFGFVASECTACGTKHLPPQRVCLRCAAQDQMTPVRLADKIATIATFTLDYLAFSPAPPVVGAVIDFDGGGRYSLELTDLDPSELAIGQRVEMTFRRLSTADGIHNYFWKARPVGREELA
jgi:hydroxymethylglutaryl-CoA synthase